MTPACRNIVRESVGVASMYPASCACFIVNASLAFLGADLYPEVPYATLTLLLTVPSLIVVPATIVSSLIADRMISSRSLACASLMLIALAGSLPAVIPGFPFALSSRVLVGLGLGFVTPIFNRLPLELFPLSWATKVQGGGNALANICGIVFQATAVALACADVSHVWLLHAVFAVPAICSLLCIPAAPRRHDISASGEDGSAGTISTCVRPLSTADPARVLRPRCPVPLSALGLAIAYGAIVMCYYPVMINVGAIVLEGGLGGSTEVAIIGAMYNVGGIAAGILYSRLYYALRRWFFPAMLAVWLVGVGASAFLGSVPGYCAGTFLCGFGLYNVFPGSLAFLSKCVRESEFALTTSLFSAVANLAMFMSTPFISFVEALTGSSNPRLPLALGYIAIAFVGMGYAWYTSRVQRSSVLGKTL